MMVSSIEMDEWGGCTMSCLQRGTGDVARLKEARLYGDFGGCGRLCLESQCSQTRVARRGSGMRLCDISSQAVGVSLTPLSGRLPQLSAHSAQDSCVAESRVGWRAPHRRRCTPAIPSKGI